MKDLSEQMQFTSMALQVLGIEPVAQSLWDRFSYIEPAILGQTSCRNWDLPRRVEGCPSPGQLPSPGQRKEPS